jgi:hypothetical protein
MLESKLSRRDSLAALGVGLVGVACGGGTPDGGSTPSPEPGSLASHSAGATTLSLLSSDEPVNPGMQRFGFALTTQKGELVTEGSPQVYVARDEGSAAMGPFPATWFPFTAYEKTGDRSPESPLSGTYAARIDVPASGSWQVVVIASDGPQKAAGGPSLLPVTDGAIPAALGSKATSVPTPVATTERALKEICTRTPPCHLHAISLDEALGSGKPTVVSFGTPLLCETQLCGPVLDEAILAASQTRAKGVHFIHVEEFLPGPDLKPPPPTLENVSPTFKAWKFASEPWTIIVDGDGIIRDRFGAGPTAADEIEAALQPLV